jgi:type IV pilus assembly protein PilB
MNEVGTSIVDDYRQIFVDHSHLLEPTAFDSLVALGRQTNRSLEPLLIEKAFISSNQYLQLASEYFHLPQTSLKINEVNHDALRFLRSNEALKLLAIPFDCDERTVKIAVAHPTSTDVFSVLVNYDQLEVQLYISTEQDIRRALILYDPNIEDIVAKIPKENHHSINPSIAELALSIIELAVIMDASDVHIEPYEDTIIVRLRVDGLLRQITSLPTHISHGLVTHFKIQASLRIDEMRVPQDGRFSLSIKGQEVNIRISLVPSLWGEKIVLRVLPKEAHLFDLNNLGFLDTDLEIIRKNITRPFGMMLVCGPTGSGKTTTLYAFLQEIGMDAINVVNISTIEDPIEYTIPRVTQIQTEPSINLTFATGLRALLRQDPDIIMVGEVRDEETADIAVRAALVGRLVISSIHTNNALGAIPRLFDMGVEPYLVSSTLVLIVAQRLARKLCTYCRQSYEVDKDIVKEIRQGYDLDHSLKVLKNIGVISTTDYHELPFFKAIGCDKCNNTGYAGRTGLYEVLEITDSLRKNITGHTDIATLQRAAMEHDMKTMFDDGLAKVILGLIDLKELLRVVYE